MAEDRNVRQNLTVVDGVLGTTTVAVFIADTALLVLFLSPVWSGSISESSELITYAVFVIAQLLLGAVVAGGLVLRALGTTGRLANRWSPISLIALRSIAVAIVLYGVTLGWTEVVIVWHVSLYLVPTTTLLIVLSLANLLRRLENQ